MSWNNGNIYESGLVTITIHINSLEIIEINFKLYKMQRIDGWMVRYVYSGGHAGCLKIHEEVVVIAILVLKYKNYFN